LGDVQRRFLSSSTPPISPPPTQLVAVLPKAEPFVIDPMLSLQLRLRWLEALLYGVRTDAKDKNVRKGTTLIRGAQQIQSRLDALVESNDSLRKYMEHYNQHANLLTPSFALSGILPSSPPSYENMSASELETFLAEMEPEIRAADRDMREIEMLENKGVTSAGKLIDHETYKPRLEALLAAHNEDLKLAASMEQRSASLIKRYATHVDTLSELFVAWDETIHEAEDRVIKIEREQVERQRLG